MINSYLVQQIKGNFLYKPTLEQEKAVKFLADFLFSRQSDSVFLLKGYAGTGKTSLIGALVKTLDQLQQKCVLLAPTGRAAKVFSHYAQHPAYTIHKKIYRQRNFSNDLDNFSLDDNLHQHTLFIVDEASMIANDGLAGAVFGTGRLLDEKCEIESYWVTPKDKFKAPHKLKTTNKRGCVVEATGDISVYAKLEDTDFELIGSYTNITDYFVSRIKRKKFKDIQLKFYSTTRFSLRRGRNGNAM